MGVPFTDKGGPSSAVEHNGVDCYGGTPDALINAGKIPNKFDDDIMSDGSLPKGVSKYGGSDNNEQPGNEN